MILPMYRTWYIFSSVSNWIPPVLHNACTQCPLFHRGGRLLKLFLFILSLVLYLARDWDDLNKVPSRPLKALMRPLPLPHRSTGLWPLLALRKTMSFLELVISSWRRARAKWRTWTWEMKSRHMMRFLLWCDFWCFSVFHGTRLCGIKTVVLSFIKIDASSIYFYPHEPSGYYRS